MNPLLDPEAFQGWLKLPMTQAYLAYLRERQSHLMLAWGEGRLMADLPEQQAQAVLLGRLSNLKFEDIREHYQIEEKSNAEPENSE